MMFSGSQIDIQAIFISKSKGNPQIKYQHIYEVRNSYFSDDQNITNPCDSNPCQNNGTCLFGFNNIISCLCLENYEGIIY
jgi:hypothetical protein